MMPACPRLPRSWPARAQYSDWHIWLHPQQTAPRCPAPAQKCRLGRLGEAGAVARGRQPLRARSWPALRRGAMCRGQTRSAGQGRCARRSCRSRRSCRQARARARRAARGRCAGVPRRQPSSQRPTCRAARGAACPRHRPGSRPRSAASGLLHGGAAARQASQRFTIRTCVSGSAAVVGRRGARPAWTSQPHARGQRAAVRPPSPVGSPPARAQPADGARPGRPGRCARDRVATGFWADG
jgi:hypothetical protein